MRLAAAAALAVLVVGGRPAEASQSMRYYGWAYVCQPEDAAAAGPWVSQGASICNEDAVLERLMAAMKHAGAGGLVRYAAACQPEPEFAVPFPRTDARALADGAANLAALRDAFRNDARVKVTARDDVIEIEVGKVPEAILKTKIAVLTFSPDGRYDFRMAVEDVMASKEIEAAMTRLGLTEPMAMDDHILSPQIASAPHMPVAMDHVTLEEALRAVARTFKSVVLYGADSCARPRQIYVDAIEPFGDTK